MNKGYVNNCGRLNLNTGRNAYFNVLNDDIWKDGDTYIAVYQCKGKWRAVGGFGRGITRDHCTLYSNTHRLIGTANKVMEVSCCKQGLKAIKELVGSSSVIFGTWD